MAKFSFAKLFLAADDGRDVRITLALLNTGLGLEKKYLFITQAAQIFSERH